MKEGSQSRWDLLLASDGSAVQLWAHEPEVAAAINAERRNPLYLPPPRSPEHPGHERPYRACRLRNRVCCAGESL
ncbi:MAG: hypothetical protein HC888_19370 [Candidatus Competibacteraceae bacterium]|nr:hypothetical protein [Candidatus Competibacteraceae bacterium]